MSLGYKFIDFLYMHGGDEMNLLLLRVLTRGALRNGLCVRAQRVRHRVLIGTFSPCLNTTFIKVPEDIDQCRC